MCSAASTRARSNTPGGLTAARPGRRTWAGASTIKSPLPASRPGRKRLRSTRTSAFRITLRSRSTTTRAFSGPRSGTRQREVTIAHAFALSGGLPQPAPCGHSPAGFFVRTAARAHERHAAGVDDGRGGGPLDDRHFHARGPSLHLEVSLGAGYGSFRSALPRAAPGVAAPLAGRTRRGNRRHGVFVSANRSGGDRLARAFRGLRLGLDR